MKIRFEPSGTHVHKGLLKVRFDIIPDVGDKTYLVYPYVLNGANLPADITVYKSWQREHGYNQHVCVPDETSPEFLKGYEGKKDNEGNPDPIAYEAWLDSLPHIWQTNPCLCWFMQVSETFQLIDLETYLANLLNKDTVATLDDCLIKPDSAHYISPFTRNKPKFTTQKIVTTDIQDLIVSVNQKLVVFSEKPLESGGAIEPIIKQSISVGSAALDRNSYSSPYDGVSYNTIINFNNPANATGTIDTVKAWWNAAGAGTSANVGTFSNPSGTTFTCNDGESLGSDLVAGSEQTYVGLTVAINAGEYIGCDGRAAVTLRIDRATSGGAGVYIRYEAQHCDPGDSDSYSLLSEDVLSLNGTGTESGGTAWEKELSDSLAIADTISKYPQKVQAETFALADTIVKYPQKAPADTLAIADSFSRQVDYERAFDDLVTITDAIGKTIGKSLAETLAIADSINILKFLNIILGDTLTIADAIVKGISLTKSETLTITDGLVKHFGIAESDAVAIAESIAKLPSLNKSDSVTIADSISKAFGLFKAQVFDIADDILVELSGLITHFVNLSDTLGITDTLVKSVSIAKSTVVTISDTLSKGISKVRADTLTIADTLEKGVTLAKSSIVTIADTFSKAIDYARSISDTVSITETIGKTVSLAKSSLLSIADSILVELNVIAYALNLFDNVIITDHLEGVLRVWTSLRHRVSRMAIRRLRIARMALFRWIERRFSA